MSRLPYDQTGLSDAYYKRQEAKLREGESMDGKIGQINDNLNAITLQEIDDQRQGRRAGDGEWGEMLRELRNEGDRNLNLQELFATMGQYPEEAELINPPKEDMVNSPSHYTLLGDPNGVYNSRHEIMARHPEVPHSDIDDWSRSVEYLLRMFGKNGLEDAKKAKWYLDKLIERMEDDR